MASRFLLPSVWIVSTASLTASAGEPRSVTGMSAMIRTEPPGLKPTKERAPYGAVVEIVEQKTAGKEAFAKIRMKGESTPLGWVSVKGNLGHVKEFDLTMKPTDAVDVSALEGIDLVMASIYNARGKYLKEEAAKLGAAPADLAAVLNVESRGRGFDDKGNPITRFENHVFFRNWGMKHKEKYDRHFTFDQNPKYKGHTFRKSEGGKFETFHLDNAREMEVLAFARSLDDTAALLSASYGAAQVMGFNHKKIGYDDVQTMHRRFSSSIRPQLDGMIAYIKNTPLCMEGLTKRDYVKFARGYNGAGKERDYAPKIQAASEAYAKVAKGKAFGG